MGTTILQAVLVLLSITQAYSIQTVYMDEACRSSVNAYVDPTIRIKASRFSTLDRHLNCSVIVRARPLDQVVAVVRSMDAVCQYMQVNVYDGETRDRFIQKMCGYSTINLNKRTFASKNQAFLFELSTASYSWSGSYDIVVTSFSTGACFDDFTCDNGRCIDSSLKCDGYNNCGDNSDEWTGCSSTIVMGLGIIVAIVIGGIFCTILVPVLIVVAVIRRRRNLYGRLQ